MFASFTLSLSPKSKQPLHVHKARPRGISYWLLTLSTVFLLLGAAVSQQAQSMTLVCFFEHINFGGHAKCTTQTEVSWIENALGHGWNDKVSSISMSQNACIVIYQHINYGGGSQHHCGHITNLSWMNDRTSSFLVFDTSAPPSPPNVPSQGEVCFFAHINYGGAFRCVNGTQSWIENGLGGGWNDRVSSIKLGPRTCLKMYQHINWGGHQYYVCNWNSASVSYYPNMGWFNDRASSYRIWQR